MNFDQPPKEKIKHENTLETTREVQQIISALLNEPVGFEEINGTCYLESDSFELSYTMSDDVFEIRNIEITNQGNGIGSQIVETLSSYAESNGMDIIASNVKDEARSFWEEMEFQEGSEPGEFFKAA